jgi:hypothetical protein
MKSIIHYWLYMVILIATCSIQSCKKESLNASNIVGTYKVTSSELEYYIFTADKQLYALKQRDGGYRSYKHQTYQLSAGVLTIQENSISGGTLYRIAETGETITLTNDYNRVTTLTKDTKGPQLLSDWVKEIVITDRFTDPIIPSDITYFGGRLYKFDKGYLVSYGIADRKLLNKIAVDKYCRSIEYVGNTLMGGNYDSIYKIDPMTGKSYFTVPASPEKQVPWAIASNGQSLTVSISNSLYDYTLSSNTWGTAKAVKQQFTRDMAYYNGALYAVNYDGFIYRFGAGAITPDEKPWHIDGYDIAGIASDGQGTFYVDVVNYSSLQNEILTVTLP